ncbi:hypothetical protein I4U23_008536 [Adineta vaga]|nr:hypothetical protein I4U23_008536 [Adineta vaga]
MNNQLETFIDYLLDTETTSEIVFIENISKYPELFQVHYLKDWELTILRKIQQVHRYAIVSTSNNVDDGHKSEDTTSKDEESSITSSDDDDDEDGEDNKDQKLSSNGNINPSNKTTEIYVDPVRQCQRLLRLLHYCQANYTHFINLYFDTLEQYRKSENEKIILVVLQQIASHLFEGTRDESEQQRLVENLSLMNQLSAQTIVTTIQSILSTNQTEVHTTNFLSKHIDILYPYTATYLNVRQEFRDTAHYLIDGDSLLLSIAHHINLQLNTYFGNTIHIIFVIERLLLTLFHQSSQCNYTLVFFTCHYHLYEQSNSILNLLRSCLIAHLSKNIQINGIINLKVKQFSSWLNNDYLEFICEEKPSFIFYHDMSTFDIENDHLLSKDVLGKLLCMYRFFGNYHQYVVQCQLYLMNKFILTETTIKCFRIEFNRLCAKKVLDDLMAIATFDRNINDHIQEEDSRELKKLCETIGENDIRLFLYLKTVMDLKDETNSKSFLQLLNPLFILHLALLIRLSIVDRHLPSVIPSIQIHSTFSQFIDQFQQRLSLNLSTCSSTFSWSKIADLFDGRLFTFTLYQIAQSSTLRLDSRTNHILKQCLEILNIQFHDNMFKDIVDQLVQSNHISFSENSSENKINVRRQKVIRISNPFVDTYLKPILSSNNNTSTFDFIEPDLSELIPSSQKPIWRIYKETGEEIDRIRDNDAERKKISNHRYRTKNLQKLYDYFSLYGKSLTTRDVRDNQYQITLPTASTPIQQNEESSTNRGDSAAASGKKKQQHKNQPKKVQPSKAEKIIELNTKRILDKRTDDDADKVKNVEAQLKQIPNTNYEDAIDLIDRSLHHFETSTKRLEMLEKKFDLQRKYLRSLKKKVNSTNEEKSKFELLQIGYFATLCEITHLKDITDAFHEQEKFMKELVDDNTLDQEKWYRFQLEKINSRLPRREYGEKDSRIQDFIPDKWQVEFLDAVDKRQSIIIVAPTASGKTYASYYAMGKVVKDKDDANGICIYVAPTKALINQVAGTIHTKFGPVFGIFTSDFRMCLPTCRILITIPECLEMLLLSPNYQRWCQRIRYCIFDEIHCMSGDTNSDVWERAMLLINCPMIGLSATVRNGQNLRDWIMYVEEKRSKLFNSGKQHPVCFIVQHERLADLNKYLYSNRQLHPLHPVSLMTAKQLTARNIPKDFSLSPFETLRLNEAMQKVGTRTQPIPTLTEYFSPGWIAERNVCNKYSQLVCKQFNSLIDGKENSTIDSIATSLKPTSSNEISYPELKPMASLIGEFVLTLKEKDLLPCIVFTDSRSLCEELAERVAQYFEELEKELRRTKYKYQIEDLEKRLAQIEKMQKSAKTKKASKSSNKRGDDEEKGNDKPTELVQMEEEDQSQLRLSGIEQELLDGVLEEGTLANRRHCDREMVDQLMNRASTVSTKLVRYMKRGVAYHHAQLNNRGRLAVEGLFRNRYVQIVFSTWTLALGVHMPTKTVAFIKDSIQLDALQYRQSSGRAGRRGFDVQGNIVFIDIPMSKIRHLTISDIPDIQTRIPTSVTFLIRLLYLNANAEDKKDAINRSLIALQCPFTAQISRAERLIDIQNRFHCLHTLDFLYRLNFINEQGTLIGLAGFLIHLHQTEPANLLFTYLMDNRLFHKLNNDEEIVSLLACLFTNTPVLKIHQYPNNSSSPKRQSLFNPKFTLRPLSPEIRQHIQSYNSLVKEIYGSYIENVIKYMRSLNTEQEYTLPLSSISFNQSSDYDNGTLEYNLHHHVSQQTQNPSISPFVGPSGLTHEKFMSNYNPTNSSWDLAYNLDLSPRIVPFVEIEAQDHTNSSYYMNSYAYDFFRHGSDKFLMSENEIDRGETYYLLSNFRNTLTSITTSIAEIMASDIRNATNNDSAFFKQLSKKFSDIHSMFSSKFDREFKVKLNSH